MTGALQPLAQDLAAAGLRLAGGLHPAPEDAAHVGPAATILLVAPDEGRFWPIFTTAPEYRDGRPDPLDRWSRRVIGDVAAAHGADACFPFDDPPPPFIRWALATERVHASPVGLLVDRQAGLWFSLRGALLLKEAASLPPPAPAPCAECQARPCLAACPAGALTGAGYDIARCHEWLDNDEGQACLAEGCRVRAACPLSRAAGRPAAQAAFHMRAFHPPGAG